MKVGIIGAGNIGATLARKLAAQGHEVKIANSKGPASLADLSRNVGATAVPKEDAVADVEVVILSIPFGSYPNLSKIFQNVPEDVIVVDTSNYYPFRDGSIPEVDAGKPESVWVSDHIKHPVVKAWNAVLAATLSERGKQSGDKDRIAIPVAGNDPKAKSVVMNLVEETGFDPVDSGELVSSWRQQPGTPAYCTELTAEQLKAALEAADRSRAASIRDALIKQFMEAGAPVSHDDMVARNRAATT
ncbi:3-hydroxyisobutyrate dehydrogenase [Sinorhizobium medicae]|uniref:NADPH-dependent F420 reductase n=1 Tax=Sinorhizobium medicae TaxID=110321 RepID=UPI000FD886B7|nr:NAD(P)-binding domain-containing protein [Sinorhizobium medicae]RVK08685.1 3-hydroxyisobutyrate dehydrogenase [Sinorhizobium medicae]